MNADIHERVATLKKPVHRSCTRSLTIVIFMCNSRQQLGVISAQQRISWFYMQFISWPAFGQEEICTGVAFNFPWKKTVLNVLNLARKQCHKKNTKYQKNTI